MTLTINKSEAVEYSRVSVGFSFTLVRNGRSKGKMQRSGLLVLLFSTFMSGVLGFSFYSERLQENGT